MDEAFMAYEATGGTDDAWDRWITKAKKLAGHSLDGDQDEDGYSLDEAYDKWEAGYTPQEYVASILRKETAGAAA